MRQGKDYISFASVGSYSDEKSMPLTRQEFENRSFSKAEPVNQRTSKSEKREKVYFSVLAPPRRGGDFIGVIVPPRSGGDFIGVIAPPLRGGDYSSSTRLREAGEFCLFSPLDSSDLVPGSCRRKASNYRLYRFFDRLYQSLLTIEPVLL